MGGVRPGEDVGAVHWRMDRIQIHHVVFASSHGNTQMQFASQAVGDAQRRSGGGGNFLRGGGVPGPDANAPVRPRAAPLGYVPRQVNLTGSIFNPMTATVTHHVCFLERKYVSRLVFVYLICPCLGASLAAKVAPSVKNFSHTFHECFGNVMNSEPDRDL